MQVKDIMATNIISVKSGSSAQAVADLIVQHQIHAIPIVNELFELQGIVAEGDFFINIRERPRWRPILSTN